MAWRSWLVLVVCGWCCLVHSQPCAVVFPSQQPLSPIVLYSNGDSSQREAIPTLTGFGLGALICSGSSMPPGVSLTASSGRLAANPGQPPYHGEAVALNVTCTSATCSASAMVFVTVDTLTVLLSTPQFRNLSADDAYNWVVGDTGIIPALDFNYTGSLPLYFAMDPPLNALTSGQMAMDPTTGSIKGFPAATVPTTTFRVEIYSYAYALQPDNSYVYTTFLIASQPVNITIRDDCPHAPGFYGPRCNWPLTVLTMQGCNPPGVLMSAGGSVTLTGQMFMANHRLFLGDVNADDSLVKLGAPVSSNWVPLPPQPGHNLTFWNSHSRPTGSIVFQAPPSDRGGFRKLVLVNPTADAFTSAPNSLGFPLGDRNPNLGATDAKTSIFLYYQNAQEMDCAQSGGVWIVSRDERGEAADGGGCVGCPAGAYCFGGFVYPTAGYWSFSSNSAPAKCAVYDACPGAVADPATGTFSAFNEDGTVNTQLCNPGYTGQYCSQCDDDYYNDGVACRSCRGTVFFGPLTAIFFSVIGVLALSVAFVSERKLFLSVTIVLCLQCGVIVFKIACAQLPGTDGLAQFINIIAIINFEVDFIKPACTLGKIHYADAFLLTIGYIAGAAVLFVLAALIRGAMVFKYKYTEDEKLRAVDWQAHYKKLYADKEALAQRQHALRLMRSASVGRNNLLVAELAAPSAAATAAPSLSPTSSPSSPHSPEQHNTAALLSNGIDGGSGSSSSSSSGVNGLATRNHSPSTADIIAEERALEEQRAQLDDMTDLEHIDRNKTFELEGDLSEVSWLVHARRRVTHSLLILGVVCYLQLSVRVFNALNCRMRDGELRLVIEPGTVCYQGDNLRSQVIAWIILFVFMIGFPLWCYRHIHRIFHQEKQTEADAEAFGYLYRDAKPHAWWFRLLQFPINFLLALSASLSSDATTALFFCMLLFTIDTLTVYILWPFTARFINCEESFFGVVTDAACLLFLIFLNRSGDHWLLFALGLVVAVLACTVAKVGRTDWFQRRLMRFYLESPAAKNSKDLNVEDAAASKTVSAIAT